MSHEDQILIPLSQRSDAHDAFAHESTDDMETVALLIGDGRASGKKRGVEERSVTEYVRSHRGGCAESDTASAEADDQPKLQPVERIDEMRS